MVIYGLPVQVIPLRYVHVLMCFFCCLSQTAIGGLLGMAIIQMVLPISVTTNDVSNVADSLNVDEDACPAPDTSFYQRNDSGHMDMVTAKIF